jgi:CRISPR-associated protein (TIGR03986 family)
MEKGKITKSGKGWQIIFDAGGTMSNNWKEIPNDWDGADIEIERVKGGINKLKKGDTVIEKKAQPVINLNNQSVKRNGNTNRSNTSVKIDFAKAPYNFIPLNTSFLKSESKIDFDTFYKERHTGYIDITIENLTPIFIRGKNENFFKINGRDSIPGSSIRGLIRMMVEILSFGKFVTLDDTKYFMRFIADKKARSYKTYYYTKMGLDEEGTNNVTHNAKAGFLIYNQNDFSYAILPASGNIGEIAHKNGKDFSHQYDYSKKGWNVFSGNMKKDEKDKKQWFIPEAFINNPKRISEKIIGDYSSDKNRNIKPLDLLKLSRNDIGVNKTYKIGVPVFYTEEDNKISSFGHTKNYRIPYEKNTKILIPEELNKTTETDIAERIFGKGNTNEISGRVFFEDAIINPVEVEVAYVYEIPQILSSPKPTSFQLYLEQNGQPKSYNINENKHVHWDTDNARIRGYKLYWHRVTINSDNQYCWFNKSFSISGDNFNKYLQSKAFKLETFEAYQAEISIINKNNRLDKVEFKMPFSKFTEPLKKLLDDLFYPKDKNANYTQSSPVKAISEGNKFKGRIRFENLTNLELGALLTAIELPETCCHKIGMGKPLGLGTVKFTAELFISDREKRYSTLFNTDGKWAEPIMVAKQKADVVKTFADFLLRKIDTDKTSIWDIERLAHLKTMLEFDPVKMASKEWLEKTRYMTIQPNEYKNRNVLPNPKEVKEL